jgi:hypothetical protein
LGECFLVDDCSKFFLIYSGKKADGHFMVKFESDDTQFLIKDMQNENLESFYHFVFERWKEKLAKYFQARPEVDEKRESGQYL